MARVLPLRPRAAPRPQDRRWPASWLSQCFDNSRIDLDEERADDVLVQLALPIDRRQLVGIDAEIGEP